jgi:3-hydroxyisobutyrate dehydrogenase-like beta-hydroxyacid dehydrogenase
MTLALKRKRALRESSEKEEQMIKKVGFVGVGTMGEPMSANLLKSGFELSVVVHRDRAPVERLIEAGATEVGSIAEMASIVEVLVSCVPDDAAVREAMLGKGGVIGGGRKGLIVVDTSTISPRTSQQVAAALADEGVMLLDAPISGGQVGAIAGTLAIMVGGPREAYDAALPVLEAMGKNITYVGGHGSALAVKLANNLIGAAAMVAISEAFTMVAKAGVEPGLAHQILSNATARSWMLQEKMARNLLADNLQPGFKLSLMRKDLGLALDFGKELDTPMFATALVHQLYTQAMGLGKGDLDCFGVAELYTDATGVSLAKK